MKDEKFYIAEYMPLFERAWECERISADEEDFLDDMRERLETYGKGAFITEKQLDWVRRIADRD